MVKPQFFLLKFIIPAHASAGSEVEHGLAEDLF